MKHLVLLFLFTPLFVSGQGKSKLPTPATTNTLPNSPNKPDSLRQEGVTITKVNNEGSPKSASETLLDLAQALIALAALVISIISLLTSREAISKANIAKIEVDIFYEFRNEKWNKCRDEISTRGFGVNFEDVKHYSHLLNHIGFLLHRKYVTIGSCYEMFGNGVIKAWEYLSPQIIAIRADPTRHFYQFHFQYLAWQMKEYKTKGDEVILAFMEEMNNYPPVSEGQEKTDNNQSTEDAI